MRQRHGGTIAAVACITAELLGAAPARALEMHGLADVRYERLSARRGLGRNGAFSVGQLDFFIQQPLGHRLDVAGEIVFETPADKDVVEVERLLVGYRFTDAFAVHAGRFHNPIGYWNTAFHHGAIYQMTIERPEFLEFEDDGGVLPVHVVGIALTSHARAAAGTLRAGVLVGNGSKVDLSDAALVPNVNADDNRNKLVNLDVTLAPTVPGQLHFGLFFNHSQIQGFANGDAETAPRLRVSQDVWGFDLAYAAPLGRRHRVELLSEWFMISDRDQLSGLERSDSTAVYLQGAWTIADRWGPYVRWEQLDLDRDDPYFAGLAARSYQRATYGLRYQPTIDSSLKAEARTVSRDAAERYMEYGAQWAFAF